MSDEASPTHVRMPANANFNAIIALGSNIGDKAANVEDALRRLVESAPGKLEIVTVSPIYKTPPWGITDQAWFVNACASVMTDLEPHDLLKHCLAVEQAMGRRRDEKWGPRLIDLDVLVYGERIVEDDDLNLPHPFITERAFVLVPLNDVAPDLVLKGAPVSKWTEAIDKKGVEPLNED